MASRLSEEATIERPEDSRHKLELSKKTKMMMMLRASRLSGTMTSNVEVHSLP
jgi:hypothetical protein